MGLGEKLQRLKLCPKGCLKRGLLGAVMAGRRKG